MKSKKLCVLILQYNSAHLTLQLLESLKQHERLHLPEYHVVVMDNASSEPMKEEIIAAHPYVHFVAYENNLGFAKAYNRYWPTIKEDHTLLLNNDCILLNDAIHQTYARLAAGGANFATCALYNADGTHQGNFANVQTPLRKIFVNLSGLYRVWLKLLRLIPRAPVGYINGAFLMIESDLFTRTGMLDERYFMYTEDLDLMIRLHKLGAKGYRYSAGRVIHLGGASADNVWNAQARSDMQMRQLYDCMRRHFPEWQVALWLRAELLAHTVLGPISTNSRIRAKAMRTIFENKERI